jgi:hypothetical protein
VLKQPGDPVVLARLQLRIGRLVGRTYLFSLRTTERARIERAHIPDRLEPARATRALLRPRRNLLWGLLALIVIGGFADWLARTVGPDVAEWLGIKNWLRQTFDLPSKDTLRTLLAAAAAGTATVLGLVVSISLIAWQTTAERYRSTSIVSFLLRERAGAAVVGLLATGFAYSLWVLATLELFSHPPYLSAALALLISTAAVISLITYRQTGLLGYLPRHIALGLHIEMTREMLRASRRGAGRSVEDNSRLVVSSDLQIFEDLLQRVEGGDPADVAATLVELRKTLSNYVRIKASLRPDGLFFEQRAKRLDRVMADVEDRIIGEGLMNPMSHEPDHLWLERRILSLVRPVAARDLIADPDVSQAAIRLWAEPLQLSHYREDPQAVGLILEEIERGARNTHFRSVPALAEQLSQVPWAVVEMAGNPVFVTARTIVHSKPWSGEGKLRSLPWQAQTDARRLAGMVRREIAITGQQVTSEGALEAEVARWRTPRQQTEKDELIGWAVRFALHQLEMAVGERGAGAPAFASMTLRVLLRIVHHGHPLPELQGLQELLLKTYDLCGEEQRLDLQSDTARAALVFAEVREWAACYVMVVVTSGFSLMLQHGEQDPDRNRVLGFNRLVILGLVHGWAEYWQEPAHLPRLARYLEPPFVGSLDGLAELLDESRLSLLALPMFDYYRWAQPLANAVHQLPDLMHRDGGMGFAHGKDHPAPLFHGFSMMFRADDCVIDLIRQTRSLRDEHRLNLILALHELLETRREQ